MKYQYLLQKSNVMFLGGMSQSCKDVESSDSAVWKATLKVMQIGFYFYIPLVIFCDSLKGVNACAELWIILLKGKSIHVQWMSLVNCFSQRTNEIIKLWNAWGLYGDRISFNNGRDFLHVWVLFLLSLNFIMFAFFAQQGVHIRLSWLTFKNLEKTLGNWGRAQFFPAFLCQMAEHPHWLSQRSFI